MRFELLAAARGDRRDDRPSRCWSTSVRDILQERVKAGPQRGDRRSRQPPFRPRDGPWRSGFRDSRRDVSARRTRSDAEVAYTGLVAAPRRRRRPRAIRRPDLGWRRRGRQDALSRSAVGAAQMSADGRNWCLITGPNLPQADFDAAVAASAAGACRVFRFREDFASLLAGAAPVGLAGRLQYGLRYPAAPAAARCSFPLPPAARPNRRCAPSGCERWGWPWSLTEDACRLKAWRRRSRQRSPGPNPRAHGLDLDGRTASLGRSSCASCWSSVKPPRSA